MDEVREQIAEALFYCAQRANLTKASEWLSWAERSKDLVYKEFYLKEAGIILAIPEIARGLEAVEKGWNAKVDWEAVLPTTKLNKICSKQTGSRR